MTSFPHTESLVNRLMEKEPSERFEDAANIADILRDELAYLQDPAHARQPTRDWQPASGRPMTTTKRLMVAGMVGLVLASVIYVCFPLGFAQVATNENENTSNALSKLDTDSILAAYEKSLSAYDCFHAEWLAKEFCGPEGKEKPTGNSDAISMWRDGDLFRWTKTRVANSAESQSPRPIGSYSEYIHDRPDRLLSIKSDGKLRCKTSAQLDFQHAVDERLASVPSSASFGIEPFPIAAFLKTTNAKAVEDEIDGHAVVAIHGQDERARMSVWLDPKLNYAARRIRCQTLKEPVRPGEEKRLVPGLYLFPTVEFKATNFIQHGETHVPSLARFSMKKRNAPEMLAALEIRLLDINFAEKLTADDFKPTEPIKNGTLIGMTGMDISIKHFWLNGEVVLDDGDKTKSCSLAGLGSTPSDFSR
ncbi:MAG: hypothetical protein R3C28_13930 [Pirellulaceae bacterium]